MSIVITVTASVFVISVDGNKVLSKDKNDIYVCTSQEDSSIVQIWETSPQETRRNLIFSSLYSNFSSPTGSTAAIVVDGISDLLENNSIEIINVNAIEIGDPVIGGISNDFLYVDGSGNLANAYSITQESDGIALVTGQIIRSDQLAKSQIDFGINGDEFNFSNDGGVGGASGFSITNTNVSLYSFGGNAALNLSATQSRFYNNATAKIDAGTEVDVGESATLITIGNLTSTTKIFNTLNLDGLTASQLTATDASKNLVSLSTATYPSLTEIARVKGVTSAIQTQIDGKQASDGTLTALAGLTITANSLIYGTGADAFAVLAQNTTATRKFLREVSSTAPVWDTLVAGDMPDLSGTYQPLDSDLTSWAAITRASGFDTFTATPSGANLASLLTTSLPPSKGGLGIDTSASTGFPEVSSGTWSIKTAAQLVADLGYSTAIDFSATINPTGFSGTPTVTSAYYFKVFDHYVVVVNFTGTSNATTCTITLPFNATLTQAALGAVRVQDNGTFQTSGGLASSAAASATITFGKNMSAAGGFTNTGTKTIQTVLTVY
jgi:hypothetical protein